MQARNSLHSLFTSIVAGRRSALAATVVLLAWGLGAGSAGAQYTSPGATTPSGAIPSQEELEKHLTEARWTFGKFRVSPWAGLRDASLVTTGGTEDETDFTLTAGVGLRGYLKTGPKVVWAAHALPEYVWWQDAADKRGLNGRYGAGLFGFWNRLHLELSARRAERQGFFSPELQELTSTRLDTLRLATEWELARRLRLYTTATRVETENQESERFVFSLLDREDERLGAGLRYVNPAGWSVSIGYEESTTDFASGARNLSNTGDAVLVQTAFIGTRFSTALELGLRTLDPEPGSEFVAFDETVGYFETLIGLARDVDLLAYTRRQQLYSIADTQAFFLYERVGARLQLELGDADLGLIAEAGEDDFQPVSALDPERIDDAFTLGVELAYALRELVSFRLRADYTEYDSNLPVFDRDVLTVGINLELRGIEQSLQIGRAEGIW